MAAAPNRLTARYLDVNTLFQLDVNPEIVQDLAAIHNSLFNLLNCPIGARFWQPEYGCSLWSYLQEPCDAETVFDCEISLLQSIMRWEPRITLDRSQTFVRERVEGDGLSIQITGTDAITGTRFASQFQALRSGQTSDITY